MLFAFAFAIMLSLDGVSQSIVNVSQQKPLYKPLSCDPVDPADIDTLLPIPQIKALPASTNNIVVEWDLVTHPRVDKYYVQATYSETFSTIDVCQFVSKYEDSYPVTLNEDGYVWCRVYSVDSIGVNQFKFSQPSEAVMTFLDMTPPVIHYISLHDCGTLDEYWTRSRDVCVPFAGVDSACSLLMLSESRAFAPYQSYPAPECSGTVVFRLSEELETKYVFGRLIDRAGNVSNSVSDTITYGKESYSYPNPFDPERGEHTNIVFWLDKPRAVVIYIYNLVGDLVLEKRIRGVSGINDGRTNPASTWNGRNGRGDVVANGGYVCVIDYGRDDPYKHKIAVMKR
jgi:hypothetical protein